MRRGILPFALGSVCTAGDLRVVNRCALLWGANRLKGRLRAIAGRLAKIVANSSSVSLALIVFRRLRWIEALVVQLLLDVGVPSHGAFGTNRFHWNGRILDQDGVSALQYGVHLLTRPASSIPETDIDSRPACELRPSTLLPCMMFCPLPCVLAPSLQPSGYASSA